MKEKSVFLFDGRLIFSYVSSSFVHIIILRSVATSSPYSTAQLVEIPLEIESLFYSNIYEIQTENFNSGHLLSGTGSELFKFGNISTKYGLIGRPGGLELSLPFLHKMSEN